MSVSFNPADDLSSLDGLESVSLRQPGGAPAQNIAGALRRHYGRREAEASAGRYTAADVQWHLPAAQLAAEPLIGAVITDGAGTRYVVQSVSSATCGARWVCQGRNLAVRDNLDQRLTLQQSIWTKGPSGAQVAAWRDVRIDLAARIQPEQASIGIENDRRLTRVTHRIFLADEVVVDHTHRFVAGRDIFRVLGYERPERIDALFVVLAAQTSGSLE